MRGPIEFRVFQEITYILILCATVVSANFCVSFSLLSEQSRNNRSQWFLNVAQVNLFNLSV